MLEWKGEVFVQREPSFCPWQEPGSAAEGTFGRRTWLGRQPFRLPKLPPKRDFRLCLGLSAAEGAAEPAWVSALEGLSAAEGAAESALFSHFMHIFM